MTLTKLIEWLLLSYMLKKTNSRKIIEFTYAKYYYHLDGAFLEVKSPSFSYRLEQIYLGGKKDEKFIINFIKESYEKNFEKYKSLEINKTLLNKLKQDTEIKLLKLNNKIKNIDKKINKKIKNVDLLDDLNKLNDLLNIKDILED